eukprot:12322154-Prorocentrum_lima.AAC.1
MLRTSSHMQPTLCSTATELFGKWRQSPPWASGGNPPTLHPFKWMLAAAAKQLWRQSRARRSDLQ